MNIPSYGKVWNFQDAAVRNQFGDFVDIEEKIDGSQFSVMREMDGSLSFRSKNVQVHPEAAGMFAAAVEAAQRLHNYQNFRRRLVFRFEYLAAKRHNTLDYDRVPEHHLMLYEIEDELAGQVFSRPQMEEMARNHNMEVVPLIYTGPLPSFAKLDEMLDRESTLGGEKIEGLVIKARDRRHDTDGKMLKAKYVSPAFKERHQSNGNPGGDVGSKDMVATLIASLSTEARYAKALQAVRDEGNLTYSLKDIGKIIARVQDDVAVEEEAYIKEALFAWAKRRVLRGVSQGVPQWYKDQLDKVMAKTQPAYETQMLLEVPKT